MGGLGGPSGYCRASNPLRREKKKNQLLEGEIASVKSTKKRQSLTGVLVKWGGGEGRGAVSWQGVSVRGEEYVDVRTEEKNYVEEIERGTDGSRFSAITPKEEA